jgi:hypothetical protein
VTPVDPADTPAPAGLTATTRNRYVLPLPNPVTVHGLAAIDTHVPAGTGL